MSYRVADGVQQLLELCVIQEANGETENATLFKPQGYSTSNNIANAGTSLQITSAAEGRIRPMLGNAIIGMALFLMCLTMRSLY